MHPCCHLATAAWIVVPIELAANGPACRILPDTGLQDPCAPGGLLAALVTVCCLTACQGTITSPAPLITPANAANPLPAIATVEAMTLDEDQVWESNEGKAWLTLADRSYHVSGPDDTAPSPDTYLFRQIGKGLFIVQASNGKEWAYGLIVRADVDYLFTFNLEGQRCTNLSACELRRFNATLQDDGCSVSNLRDLTALLLDLRRRFP
jgi:hypothetical protein